MAILFLAGVLAAYAAETRPNPALAGLRSTRASATWRARSALRVVNSPSCYRDHGHIVRAVNSMHDSFNPLGAWFPWST